MKRILALLLISAACLVAKARAVPTPAPAKSPDPAHYGGELIQQTPALLQFQPNPAARQATEKMIQAHEDTIATGARGAGDLDKDLQSGKARADAMMEALKNEQFQKALKKVTEEGRSFLEENEGLQGPAAFIAGAAAFWYGTTINLFQGDSMRMNTRIEGRTRRSEFSLESPLLNGKVVFGSASGVEVNVNRSIASIGSTAEVSYFGNTHSVSTQIVHPLGPNLNFSIGTSQIPEMDNRTDGRAKLEYRINF